MKIKKGDIVHVISGSYSGKEGRVLKVINDRNRLVVEGINMHGKEPDYKTNQIIENSSLIFCFTRFSLNFAMPTWVARS